MSTPKWMEDCVLEEITDEALRYELERRENARAAGVCDYCGRRPDTPACRFPRRHVELVRAPKESEVSAG